MANQKVSQLVELTAPIRGDLLHAIDDPSGTPVSKKLTHENLLKGAPIIVAANDAPADWKRHASYVCNGTNDEDDINTAIAALPSGGGQVMLSEGQFNIEAPITDQNLDNVTFVGQGNSTILYLPDGANAVAFKMIHLTSVDYWTLANFKIDGNRANNTDDIPSNSIHCDTVNHCTFKNLEIVNSPSTGILINGLCTANLIELCRITNVYDSGIYLSDRPHECVVNACHIDGVDTDFGICVRYGPRYNVISNCHVRDVASSHIRVQGITGYEAYGNVVIGCTVNGNETTPDSRTSAGIHIDGGTGDIDRNAIIGNSVRNVRWGIYGTNGGSSQISGNTIEDCDTGMYLPTGTHSITGNFIYNMEGTGSDGRGIEVRTEGNVITGNVIDTVGIDCIRLQNATQTTVIGNRLTNAVGNGLEEAGTADNNIISLNNVEGNGAAAAIVTVGALTKIRCNEAFVTEASGIGTIVSGTVSDTITHGLDYTPDISEITVTLREGPTYSPGAIWINTVGSTTFQVNCENDPGGSDLDFSWAARKI